MRELFQGYIMEVQEGVDFSSAKFDVLNKITIKNYIEYYMKYQKYRN